MDAATAVFADAPAPLFKKRAPKSAARKRAATPPPAADSDSSGYTSTEDEGQRIKRRKKSAVITASSAQPTSQETLDLSTTKYTADRTAEIKETNDATKQSNWYDEKSLLGTTRNAPRSTKSQPTYDTTAIPKNPDLHPPSSSSSSTSKPLGPVKAPTNIRTITVTDFAPDVCKDYKQTGFCGFSDTCKFLHAREDYKQGWELDRDWEKLDARAKTREGRRGKSTAVTDGMDSEEEEAALENIPFACVIHQGAYRNPIVTKCGHYFCEECALRRYRKNPACAVCGAGTGGVFNGAKLLSKLLEKKRERARVRREKAVEAGKEVSEEDDGGGREGEGAEEE